MYPFVASQAIARKQAKRMPPKPALRNAVADPLVQTVRTALLWRFLDALVESRRRKADPKSKPARA
jgi:hypothetical protein